MRRAVNGPIIDPNSSVIETWPSSAGYTNCRWIGPTRMPPAVRSSCGLSFGTIRTPGIPACITACCADTSTCWPRPLAWRSVSPSIAPTAASAPACSHACGTDVRTGARSRSPVSAWQHPAARIVRSDAAQPAFGPSVPNAVTDTWTTAGLAAATSAGSNWPLSSSTSAVRTSSMTSAGVAQTDALLAAGCTPRTRARRPACGAGARPAARRGRPRPRARPASSRPPGRGGPWRRSPDTATTSLLTPPAPATRGRRRDRLAS